MQRKCLNRGAKCGVRNLPPSLLSIHVLTPDDHTHEAFAPSSSSPPPSLIDESVGIFHWLMMMPLRRRIWRFLFLFFFFFSHSCIIEWWGILYVFSFFFFFVNLIALVSLIDLNATKKRFILYFNFFFVTYNCIDFFFDAYIVVFSFWSGVFWLLKVRFWRLQVVLFVLQKIEV